MILDALMRPGAAEQEASEGFDLMRALYPICRSITGPGVRATLDQVAERIPLRRFEVPSGTAVFDWEVPVEWTLRDAYIADTQGRRLIDVHAQSLHIVSYSTPVDTVLTREALEPKLHSLPDRPDAIPYRTSYYRRDWGFCLRHRDRAALGPGPFRVVIDADLAPGHLSYAECTIAGSGSTEAILYTHVCHPSLANDNLTGIAAAVSLARALRSATPRHTWRVVFGPGTIGSLTWLAQNEGRLDRIRGGMVIGLLGDAGPLTYKRSRRGDTATDRIAELVLAIEAPNARIEDFEPYGYDERQFCSPGIDLAVGRLTRTPNGRYPEYHTSADDLDFVRAPQLAGAIRALARLVSLMDANRTLVNLKPRGEPQLGKRGLYRTTGGTAPGQFENALLWVLSLSDGRHDIAAIARRSGLPFETVDEAARALETAGLAREIEDPSCIPVAAGPGAEER